MNRADRKAIQPFSNFLPLPVMESRLLFFISILSTYPSHLSLYSKESFKVEESLKISPLLFFDIISDIRVVLNGSVPFERTIRRIKLFAIQDHFIIFCN
jgi:hypothetical protein